jgi:hypothetical protein
MTFDVDERSEDLCLSSDQTADTPNSHNLVPNKGHEGILVPPLTVLEQLGVL